MRFLDKKNLLSLIFSILSVFSVVDIFAAFRIAAPTPAQAAASNEAVETVRHEQRDRDGDDDSTLAEVVTSQKEDRFTQTEAHMQLPKIRKKIQKKYPNAMLYSNIISTIIANEAKFKKNYYAFYHTTSTMWRVTQDLYTQLFANANPGIKVARDFKFTRFNNESSTSSTAQDFLANELKEKGLVNDNSAAGAILLSVNLSLFGNVGFDGECSWDYFVNPNLENRKKPTRKKYEDMMDSFGLTHDYIDDILGLIEKHETDEETIMQILVPKEKVSQIGYLAWVRGVPADQSLIKTVLDETHGKLGFEKHTKPVLEKLTSLFVNEDNRNDPKYADVFKTYDEMLAGVGQGAFNLASYLKIYCNKPWKLSDINDVTGRLLFTPDVLLNPESDVKFYRFNTAKREKLEEYRKELNEIVDKLFNEKKSREVPAAAA